MQLPESKLTRRQVKTFEKLIKVDGKNGRIIAEVRHDDSCGNGHNSFAITGTIYSSESSTADRYFETGGCIHDEITKHFPELAPFIKWHLSSTDGPMHYVANTLYHSRDRTHRGVEIGAPVAFTECLKFEGIPFTYEEKEKGFFNYVKNGCFDTEVIRIDHPKNPALYSANYTLGNFEHERPSPSGEWYDCLFKSEREALEWLEMLQTFKVEFVQIPTKWCEEVEPNLEGARRSAVWPEATLEQLQNKELLEARLPQLMEDFKKDVESLGLIY